MANYSVCGIDCDICKFRKDNGCKGWRENEVKFFWENVFYTPVAKVKKRALRKGMLN